MPKDTQFSIVTPNSANDVNWNIFLLNTSP